MKQTFTIRDARQADAPLILSFIRELAEYEKLSHEVVATEGDIQEQLFGTSPKAFAMIAEDQNGAAAGFALCFYNFSTFLGRPGIYIEDVFVRPEFRGGGLGKMFFRAVAERAVREQCGRVQWSCLNWNEPTIQFYKSLNAVPLDEWTGFRLEGQGIRDLAEGTIPNKKKAA